ncbi:hypothetical protein FB451DRAFT_1192722 [Mycena latifolia]|nr:hypothetical protein FB451DRAFT_1192722 [Mycena latifolia]
MSWCANSGVGAAFSAAHPASFAPTRRVVSHLALLAQALERDAAEAGTSRNASANAGSGYVGVVANADATDRTPERPCVGCDGGRRAALLSPMRSAHVFGVRSRAELDRMARWGRVSSLQHAVSKGRWRAPRQRAEAEVSPRRAGDLVMRIA